MSFFLYSVASYNSCGLNILQGRVGVDHTGRVSAELGGKRVRVEADKGTYQEVSSLWFPCQSTHLKKIMHGTWKMENDLINLF